MLYNIVMVFVTHHHESATGIHMFPPSCIPLLSPSPTHLYRSDRAPALGALLHASNLHWSSILHMVIYMFQCYSLKSPHPHLLPQTLKVCSLHLCLFCCLVYTIIVTVFLNSIYQFSSVAQLCPALSDPMSVNKLYWCFSF